MIKAFLILVLLPIALKGQAVDTLDAESTVLDSTIIGIQEPLPEFRSDDLPLDTLEKGAPFFDYKLDLGKLQSQIDSLKRVIRIYQKKQTLPSLDEDLLNLIKVPEFQHRIVLENGTVVFGEIVSESTEEIVLQTRIGRLVLRREFVVRMDEELPPSARVEFVGEPFVNGYPDRDEITGQVKNSGEKRADFVRVIGQLWTSTTETAGVDSTFIAGKRIKYQSGVVTDTSLEPGATASFRLIVPHLPDKAVGYRTYDLHWVETR